MSKHQVRDVHYHIHYHDGRRRKRRRRRKRGRNAKRTIVPATAYAPVPDDPYASVTPLGLPANSYEPSGSRLALPDCRTTALTTATADPLRSDATLDQVTPSWTAHAVALAGVLSIGFLGSWAVAAAIMTVYAIGMIGIAVGGR